MPVALLFNPQLQFTDANGDPIPFAKVYSYAATTTTPLSLYQDAAGVTPHLNPVTADGGGRLTAYALIGSAYKLNVLDQNNVQVPGFPIDNMLVVPNGDPTLIDDYSATVAQSNLTSDPGEIGSENLATSAAEELEQIRFVLGEMKGELWRTSHTIKVKQGDTCPIGLDSNLAWAEGATSSIVFHFRVPYDYATGTIVFYVFRRLLVSPGTAIMTYQIGRLRDGATALTLGSGNLPFAPGDGSTHRDSLSFGPGDFLAGDILRVNIARLGADAGDTTTGGVSYDGHYFQYTGFASR